MELNSPALHFLVCMCYFSIAMIKHHDHINLKKEGFTRDLQLQRAKSPSSRVSESGGQWGSGAVGQRGSGHVGWSRS